MSLAVSDWPLAVALLLTGMVHLIPLIGVRSVADLHRLYGVPMEAVDPTTILLLRHRAVLFGLLGLLFGAASPFPAWHLPASLIALASMLSFVMLAGGGNGHGLPIRRVVRADIALSGLVLIGLIARLMARDQ